VIREIGEVLLRGVECPRADPNPGCELDPTNEPPRRSYAMLTYNQDHSLEQAWDWLFSESAFATIIAPDDLADRRHGIGANVYFRDGHVERLRASRISFPTQ
jgi:prepilin-type processing-associated H-X9-DG protein